MNYDFICVWVAVIVLLGSQQRCNQFGCPNCGISTPYFVKCGTKLKVDDQFAPVCGATVPQFTNQEYPVNGNNVVDRIKQLLHEGSVTHCVRRYYRIGS